MFTININGNISYAEAPVLLSTLLAPTHTVEMPCGGRKNCGKCKISAKGSLSPISDTERRILTEEELSSGIRLACCTTAIGDCVISSSTVAKNAINTDGELPDMVLRPAFNKYGIAIDIGTTTLAARLYTVNGALLSTDSELNPQKGFGADVISRIEAALDGKATELATVIRDGLNGIIANLAKKADIDSKEIDGAVITGNTVMLHLLTETSTEPLSHAPFNAERLFGETVTAEELSLSSLAPQTPIYLPRCAEAFVGADITTALLASGISGRTEPSILVDIGTNGEMALVKDGEILLCSTAAGPAFEGAGLSMGMNGKTGAIDKVTVENGELTAHVIGETEPMGICGSGVVDAVAALLETEVLDETGCLDDDEAVISAPVVLTQEDIRMVQLAKSAIHAGLRTLMHYAKLDCNDISELCVAGGFGSYLDIRNAGKIGLIPEELVPRVKILGNAALTGAAMMLLNTGLRGISEKTIIDSKVITLSSNPVFTEEYMERMFF